MTNTKNSDSKIKEPNAKMDTVDKSSPVDLRSISLPEGSQLEKAKAFFEQVGNPYFVRVGDIGVHVEFSDEADAKSLQDCILSVLINPEDL